MTLTDIEHTWLDDTTVELFGQRADGLQVRHELRWATPALAEANIERAIEAFVESDGRSLGVEKDGQGRRARKLCVRGVTVWLHHVWGPPTWWLPRLIVKANRRKAEVMVGWLRHGYAVCLERNRK